MPGGAWQGGAWQGGAWQGGAWQGTAAQCNSTGVTVLTVYVVIRSQATGSAALQMSRELSTGSGRSVMGTV